MSVSSRGLHPALRRVVAPALVVLLVVVLLAGCGASPSPSAAGPPAGSPPAAEGTSPGAASLSCDSPPDCAQLMLAFAFVVNLSSGRTTPSPITQDTEASIDCALDLTPLAGWTLAWGPAIALGPASVPCSESTAAGVEAQQTPENTLAVFELSGGSEYVVAVAATNPLSIPDLKLEDLEIEPQPWRDTAEVQHGYVTTGTIDGLDVLVNLEDGNQTLEEYLQTITGSPGVTVYVTGHSLGGALAPVLGLWLRERQGESGGWDPQSNAQVMVYSFAGVTPGDAVFADYLDSELPGDALTVIDNTNDVVPRAWKVDTLQAIQTLYPVGMRPDTLSPVLDLLVARSGVVAADSGIVFTRLGTPEQQQLFAGEIVSDFPSVTGCRAFTAAQSAFPQNNQECHLGWTSSDVDFAIQAIYQHVCAYPVYLGIESITSQIADCGAPPPSR